MAEQIARFKPGVNVPGYASAAQVLAGRLVQIVGPKSANGDYAIGHCGAGLQAFGVSEADSGPTTDPATAQSRRVNVVRRGAIARIKAGADITVTTAAIAVKSDANGQAIPQGGTGVIVGYALNSAVAANGDYVEVDLI